MAKNPGSTVAVTGASGYVAGRLIEELESDDRVGRILAFDIRPPDASLGSKVVFDSVDIRDPALESRLAGVDVLVHLAFVMDPIHDEAEMRDVNVNGSQNVFRCAGKAGVGKIIYTSSGVAYGAHPNNDFPLTEDSPLRANLDFSYPAHKLEVEYVVREFREDFPEVKVVVYRPAIVFGPGVDSAWSHLMEMPAAIAVRGYAPPLQFVHEDDVAAALSFAVFEELDGAYNLCPSDWVDWEDMLAILNKRSLQLPEPLAFSMAERLWSMGLAEAPAGMLHYVMHPWVMSPSKLQGAGFSCRHSSYDTFVEAATKSRSVLRLGGRSVAKSDLKKGLLTGAGVVAGLVAWRAGRSLGGRRAAS